MPSKKKKYNARFPAGRIKKIMQTDEEVGKVAQAVPVIISRTLELFVESLLTKAMQITSAKNAKTLTPSHMKQCILSESRFDFLKDLVKALPDVAGSEHDDPLLATAAASTMPVSPQQQTTTAPVAQTTSVNSGLQGNSTVRKYGKMEGDVSVLHSTANTTPNTSRFGTKEISQEVTPQPLDYANSYTCSNSSKSCEPDSEDDDDDETEIHQTASIPMVATLCKNSDMNLVVDEDYDTT